MLLEETSASAWFLLMLEETLLYADCCQPRIRTAAWHQFNNASAIGSFGVASASLASRISSCHCPLRFPLGRCASCGVVGVRLLLAPVNKQKSPSDNRSTDGD